MARDVHEEARKVERWAVTEWIVARDGLELVALLAVLLAIGFAVGFVYLDGISHLSRAELRTFVKRDNEAVAPRSMTGPLFGRLSEPHER